MLDSVISDFVRSHNPCIFLSEGVCFELDLVDGTFGCMLERYMLESSFVEGTLKRMFVFGSADSCRPGHFEGSSW